MCVAGMDRKQVIHSLLNVIAFELLQFIKESETPFEERWVPSAYIKEKLELNLISVPVENKQYGEKAWFFATVARMLEDQKLVEYKKEGSRAFYRSVQP